jgi:hypothetical protein
MYGQPVPYGGVPPPPMEMAMAANAMLGPPQQMMMTPQPMMNQPQMMAPMTPQPMYHPPNQQGPTIITMTSTGGTKCPFCSENTGSILRRRAGCVTWAWCVCLMFTTGCCFIPFCVDGCKDIEQVCERCSNVKNVTPANCC